MLTDGMNFLDSAKAVNFQIDSGAALPTAGNNIGELFFLTAGTIGLYSYSGAEWVLVGGGGTGDGTITINGETSNVFELTTDDIPAGATNKYFTAPQFTSSFNAAISGTSLNALADVQTERTVDNEVVGPEDGQVLAYSAVTGQWAPSSASVNVTSVNDKVGDVVLTSNDVPEIVGPNTVVENMYWTQQRGTAFLNASSIKLLGDVSDTMSPLPNDVLMWTGSQWSNQVIPSAPVQTVAGRTGAIVLTTSDVEEGSRLYWTQQRFNEASSALVFNSLADVAVGGAVAGEYLQFDGNDWVPGPPVGAPVQSVNGRVGVVTLTSDDVPQGSTNKYLTPETFEPLFDTAFDTGFGLKSVNALSDVSTSGAATGQYLTFNGTSWIPGTPPGAPVASVNGQTDVVSLTTADIPEPAGVDSDYPRLWFSKARFNSNFGAKKLSDLSQVGELTNLQPFDVLLWTGTEWSNVPVPSAPVQSVAGRTGAVTLTTTDVPEGVGLYWTPARFTEAFQLRNLSELKDVSSYSAADDGKYLKATLSGGQLQWEPADPPGAPVSSVAGRTGAVVLTSTDVAEGSNLYFTQERVVAAVGNISLDELADVTTTAPQTGHVLRWNGSQWVNDFAAVSNSAVIAALGFTPANKAGETFTGAIAAQGTVSGTRFISTTTSQPPLTVASTNLVTNLNAELVGGKSRAQLEETHMTLAISDETSALVVGDGKITFRAPYAMSLYKLPRASISTAGGTLVSVDIRLAGTSIFGATKLNIDAGEKTSVSSSTTPTLNITEVPDDAELTFDIKANGSSAAGLKVTLYYKKT